MAGKCIGRNRVNLHSNIQNWNLDKTQNNDHEYQCDLTLSFRGCIFVARSGDSSFPSSRHRVKILHFSSSFRSGVIFPVSSDSRVADRNFSSVIKFKLITSKSQESRGASPRSNPSIMSKNHGYCFFFIQMYDECSMHCNTQSMQLILQLGTITKTFHDMVPLLISAVCLHYYS